MAAVAGANASARAGLLRRLAALLYETLILAAMLITAGFALSPFVSPGTAHPDSIALPGPTGRMASFAVLFGLGAWFYGWCWSRGRRTLPMKTWRIGLIGVDGSAVTPRQALTRYVTAGIGPALALAVHVAFSSGPGAALAWPLFMLNWLWAIVDRDRQFLHDRLARTRLVSSPR